MRVYRNKKGTGIPDSIDGFTAFALRASLRRHRRVILVYAGFMALQFLVYGLYGLPWGPAVYTAVLCCLLAGTVGLFTFWAERGRLLRLRLLEKHAPAPGQLPGAEDAFEQAYQEILAHQGERFQALEEKSARNAAEATRYYTLWSHQIKTPIAAMRLLLQEEEPDRSALEQELFKTEQYVEMVLQYQRLGGVSRDLMLQEYSLEGLVRQAVKRTATLFIHKRIALRFSPVGLSVITDEKWLVFVLEQLLTNAVKYTPEGGAVTVSIEPPGLLSIADTGIGIRPEDLPRVTEWGYTGYNGRLDKRSTGVGLSLCRQALEMLGHEMHISSEIGRGTTVTLDLYRERLEVE